MACLTTHTHKLKQHCIKVSQACFYICIENMGWKCTMSVSTSLWHPQTGYVSWMLLKVNNKISYGLFFPLQNTTQRAPFSSIICLPKWTNDTETVWLDNKCVFQVLILNYCSGMCFCGSRWESVPKHEHVFIPFLLLSFSLNFFPVTWPRTHLFATVIWSGLPTTCAPTRSRRAAPAAPAHGGSQTNASGK